MAYEDFRRPVRSVRESNLRVGTFEIVRLGGSFLNGTVVLDRVELQLVKKCAVKGAGLQRVQLPPGNWFAPPGNNRNGGGGNEAVGAFGAEGARRLGERAGHNVSER